MFVGLNLRILLSEYLFIQKPFVLIFYTRIYIIWQTKFIFGSGNNVRILMLKVPVDFMFLSWGLSCSMYSA